MRYCFKEINAAEAALWHPWFAWYPVMVGKCIVWLETVERRWRYHHSIDGGWWEVEYQ
jgi:hypothetical protein